MAIQTLSNYAIAAMDNTVELLNNIRHGTKSWIQNSDVTWISTAVTYEHGLQQTMTGLKALMRNKQQHSLLLPAQFMDSCKVFLKMTVKNLLAFQSFQTKV